MAEGHTAKPVLVVRGNQAFKGSGHPEYDASKGGMEKADYVIRDGKMYAAGDHTHAGSPHAQYHISEDGKIFTTHHNEKHLDGNHVMEMGKEMPDPSFIQKVIDNA